MTMRTLAEPVHVDLRDLVAADLPPWYGEVLVRAALLFLCEMVRTGSGIAVVPCHLPLRIVFQWVAFE